MSQPHHDKVQLKEVLIAKGIQIDDETAFCEACDCTIRFETRRLIRSVLAHFSSYPHQLNSGWLLKSGKENKFFIETLPQIKKALAKKSSASSCNPSSIVLEMMETGSSVLNSVDFHRPEPVIQPAEFSAETPTATAHSTVTAHSTATAPSTDPSTAPSTGPSTAPATDPSPSRPTIMATIGIPIENQTQDHINELLKAPFVVEIIRNIMVNIGLRDDTKPNRRQHNPVIKDTISKFACSRGTTAACDLSSLIRGTSRSTILGDLAKATPILSWIDKDNILLHFGKAKGKVVLITA